MNGVLGELGKKLAERWVSLLALPGALFLGTLGVALTLSGASPFDHALLRARLTAWSTDPDLRSAGTAVLLLAAVLLGSVAFGTAAAALGGLVDRLWHLPGRHGPSRALVTSRRARWHRAVNRADAPAATPDEVAAAIAAADRICALEPHRPTWTGDRFRVVRERVRRSYSLDLDAAWPRIWLLLPETAQTELSTAAEAYRTAGRRWGWALLYAALAWWWWPALLIAACIATGAQLKGRQATRTLADLIEATVDVYYRTLVGTMGYDAPPDRPDPGHGVKLSAWFRKSRWDPDSPMFE
ncbi:hypothetical protein [Streptomyces sp. NPDC059452]|uniref:hypothetical protein n=1 Tax=Streptomyces sp. NPDC059452 TaxID=3346835 RepID=UPI0036A4855C